MPDGDGLAVEVVTPETIDDAAAPEMAMIQTLNTTLKELFGEDPDTYLWGQDVAYRRSARRS